ncbi:hypothetical protein HU200_050065 [Digitaria exilis]|uniref:Uncharacterized protein n=1 Tax=Digitaria exilis TaxID=1010633 RepID=A0A835AYL5_9POAL|nr:hypothetical protein HU200_050065 [Digitaria exilis]
MFVTTVYTSKLQDCRNSWHCQWWLPKTFLLGASIIISTFTPTHWIQLYGEVAPYGAGIFLFIQLLSVIRYITRFNYGWCHIDTGNRYLLVITLSILLYSGSTVGITLMAIWYTASRLNATFIGTTVLLAYLMPLISLKHEANGFLVGPGLVGAYIVFLCYSAIKRFPYTYNDISAKLIIPLMFQNWQNFVAELLGTVAAGFSTGSEYKYIQLRSIVVSEDDVPYGYGFFHFIFATGSMYFGMLFVGWDTHRPLENWNVDVGWTSTWVHFVNEAMAAISFGK